MSETYQPNPGPESRWTRPRLDCPNPQWWTSDDDDSTEHEVTELVAGFVRATQPEYVLETGAAWGQTSEAIGDALHANGHGRLVSLEPDPVRARYARARCTGLPVDIEQVASLDYTPTAVIDFAWLDSLLHLRTLEARQWRPWLRAGAIIGMHDTGPQHDLRWRVEELLTEGWLRPMFLPTPRGVMFAEVLASVRS